VIIVEEYGDALRAFDVDPFEVCAYVLGYSLAYERGEPWQYGVGAQLLHSPIDVDRLDYITRDNYMTGAGVLSFDVDRMVDAYTAHPEEGLALTEKALDHRQLPRRADRAVHVGHPAPQVGVREPAPPGDARRIRRRDRREPGYGQRRAPRELDDNAVLERLRIAARDRPRFDAGVDVRSLPGRRFPATCWKHRIALADRVGRDLDGDLGGDGGEALDEFTAWLTEGDDRLERLLADALDVPVHEVWIDRSYVPAYDPDELEDIPIAYGGTTRSVGDWGCTATARSTCRSPSCSSPTGRSGGRSACSREAFEREVGETKQA